MSSATTPVDGSNKRSTSRNRLPTSRPTTPLRPASRSSLRDGQSYSGGAASAGNNHQPLESLEPAFAELSDSMADLEANLMHMQLMHESLARFSESFASFLYGLNMNAFCVDFPEAPIPDSFKRARQQHETLGHSMGPERFRQDFDAETTFMTTDTSFVENPTVSSKATPRFETPAPAPKTTGARGRGVMGGPTRGGTGRGSGRGTRASSLARAKGSSVR